MNQLVLDRSNVYFSLFPDHLSYIDSCLETASYKLKDYDWGVQKRGFKAIFFAQFLDPSRKNG